ncbi:hypothetical protein EQG49_05575 [Periweissella cryptocerci]|uniref:Uncharacterized protein n=1 Tax=Periweissella cryptocerci TaxID=2506420 RepID=A0A4V1AIL9_9LACO|nr:hypothetical protein [Periweissella cryptocerci]QBO35965.1 hypothetical protein EQG49_05575 [Periweissella cryptocerci]
MNKKVAVSIAAGLIVLSSSALSVFAGTSYAKFNITVAPVNGSSNTSNQTKSTSAKSGRLKINSLGKAIDVREASSSAGTGRWIRVNKTGTFTLPNGISKGTKAHAGLSTDVTTLVHVLVKGSFRSN